MERLCTWNCDERLTLATTFYTLPFFILPLLEKCRAQLRRLAGVMLKVMMQITLIAVIAR